MEKAFDYRQLVGLNDIHFAELSDSDGSKKLYDSAIKAAKNSTNWADYWAALDEAAAMRGYNTEEEYQDILSELDNSIGRLKNG